ADFRTSGPGAEPSWLCALWRRAAEAPAHGEADVVVLPAVALAVEEVPGLLVEGVQAQLGVDGVEAVLADLAAVLQGPAVEEGVDGVGIAGAADGAEELLAHEGAHAGEHGALALGVLELGAG